MRLQFLVAIGLALTGLNATASRLEPVVLPPIAPPGASVRPFVAVPAGTIALRHVRVIDGTGAAPKADRTLVMVGGRIAAVQSSDAPIPTDAVVVDLSGATVLPGLVGMHDHIFHIARPNLDATGHSDPPVLVLPMIFSAPRLYLANGVTTIRTTGSVEPYADLNLKTAIDGGELPGPHMEVTGPYLEGASSRFIQMHHLKDEDDARRTVAFWAEQGVTSFKAYENITREELRAAIAEAHRRGLKITGHLCSISYPEAAQLGIDDLEHGFFVNTQNDPGKEDERCPATSGRPTLRAMDPDGPEARALIRLLVDRRVAVTSTLPIYEPEMSANSLLYGRSLDALSSQAREAYLFARTRALDAPAEDREKVELAFRNGQAMERRFVAAGGLLLAGPDPTASGGIVPGFGDLREVELLVGGGFGPLDAIRIATLNGATYLGLDGRIGSIEPGKDADLLVVSGDPSRNIADIENVRLVFKDGVGYDPKALLASVRGRFGEY